jgi:HK97 family phage major capsid protein
MWKKIKAANEERAAKAASMATILDKAATEKRDNTAEEITLFEQLRVECTALEKHIERLNQAAEAAKLPGGENRALPGRPALGEGLGSENEDPEKPITERNKVDGFATKDLRRYSLLRAIRTLADKRPLDGIEGEVSKELEKRSGEPAKGFYFPSHLPTGIDFTRMERRTFNTSTGAGGIPTILDVSNFIELLRNRMCMSQAGTRYLTEIVGSLALPKQTGGGTAYWVADEAAPTASAQAVGQVTFNPNTLGAYTDISRKLMLQSSLSAEGLVRDDLTRILAIELDRAGINGSGSSNQPTGILQQSGIGSVALGTNGSATVTFANVVALETAVAVANADVGTLAYISNSKVRGLLKTTLKNSVANATYIWETGPVQPDGMAVGEMNGYRALTSNNVPWTLTKGTSSGDCSACIFGNFNDAVYAMWGGLDILVDPYSNSNTGSVRIVALQDADFQLRHAASFAAITDMLAG